MSTVYLFCLIAAVAANPIFQRLQLAPACATQSCQTAFPAAFQPACPAACAGGCPAQTCSPQVSPAPCQNCQICQNPLQNILSTVPIVVRPSGNNCPCNNCGPVQNPMVNQPVNCPCNNCGPVQNPMVNQPVNPDALSQLVLSQILGPQVQTLLAPNGKTCDQCEAPKSGAMPNIINNYIIIPPEYYKANETNTIGDPKKIQGKDANVGRRRKPNRQPKNDKAKSLHDLILDYLKSSRNDDDTESSAEINPARKKEGNQNDSDYSCDEKEVRVNNPRDYKIKQKQAKDLQEYRQFVENYNHMMNSRKRYPEYLKNLEEAIVKDFCAKNPSIPEEIARSLLANVIRQIKNREISYHRSYYAPSDYSPYQSYQQPNNNGQEVMKIQEKDRKHNGRRQKRPKKNRSESKSHKQTESTQSTKNCDKCDNTVELNPDGLDIEKEKITTEKTTTTEKTNKLPKTVTESQIESKKDFVDQLEEIKDKYSKLNEIETTTMNYNKLVEFPELGNEDKVPTFYDNGVEDFYPDFRGDVPYYESGEELNRYHYTTDRNGNTERKRYVNHKKHKSYLGDSNSDTLPVPVEEVSLEDSNSKNDEVQFRIPPSLELPDFKTKQINKYYSSEEINDKFVPDDTEKASVYSDSKPSFRVLENDVRPVKVFSKDKKGRTSIETVLGHSKVVRYGQERVDLQDDGSTPAITYYLPEEAMTEDRIQLPDGEGVVVAKSIRDLEQIWV